MKRINARNKGMNRVNGMTWLLPHTRNENKIDVWSDDHIVPLQDGVTLIALVITIILMLILAGAVISLTLGENGLIDKTKYAVEATKKAEVKEEIEIAILDIQSELQAQKEPKDLTNTDVIEELPNKINSITINEDMTGEYKGYEYWIDEEYKVHVGEKTTNPIKIKVSPTYVGTSSCTIEVEATSTKGNIVNYQYKINNEMKQETDQNTATIEELEPVTKYMVTVVVTDEKGNTKTSTPITITTKERTYIVKDGVQKIQGQTANATLIQEDDYLKLSINSTTKRAGWYFTYDVSRYNTIKIDAEVINKGQSCMIDFVIFISNPLEEAYSDLRRAKIATGDTTKKVRDIYEIDIKELQEDYIIACLKNKTGSTATSATMNIYNLWLEE